MQDISTMLQLGMGVADSWAFIRLYMTVQEGGGEMPHAVLFICFCALLCGSEIWACSPAC